MTVRVVPLNSREAADARTGGTVAEWVALVAMLSGMQWALTRRPLPAYSRETMPVVGAHALSVHGVPRATLTSAQPGERRISLTLCRLAKSRSVHQHTRGSAS